MSDSTKPDIDTILARIVETIAEQASLDPEVLRPEITMNDVQISSITQLEVLFAIEESFDIYLPEDQDSDGSLRDLALLVQRLVAEKAG